jgi:hypothetical protein
MRSVLSEAFRYIVSLTRTRDVTVVHTVRDGVLMVVFALGVA